MPLPYLPQKGVLASFHLGVFHCGLTEPKKNEFSPRRGLWVPLRGTHMGARRVPIRAPKVRHEKRKRNSRTFTKRSRLKRPKLSTRRVTFFTSTHADLMCTLRVHIWGPLVPIRAPKVRHEKRKINRDLQWAPVGCPYGHP